ncbi:unnamed protein product [Paramecium sonneborni]|uniref:Uncharacterized protein n=1 Tax=Paramecium sonneborni TaxID=65129 RepID=A0A8S1LQB1_9CILI|nr:unnamed protein product [Paramecium sonneborni]
MGSQMKTNIFSNKQYMILIIFLILSALGTITHDQSNWVNWSLNCQNGDVRTEQINFSDSFANTSKVIVTPGSLDFASISPSYELNFLFQNKIHLPYQSIDVITVTDLNPLSEATYPIANPNFKIAKVSILSFSYSGAFEIQTANSNLLHLGYQIILGTTEALTLFETKATTSKYTNGGFNFEANCFFLLLYSKLQFSNTSSYKLKFFTTTVGSAVQYSVQTNKNFKHIYISQGQVVISKYLDRNINEKTSKQMNLVEENKTEGQDPILVADTIQKLNVIVYFKCYPNKKVHAVINKCNNSLKQDITLDRNCHGSMNIIYFYMRFTSQSDFKELAITTTTNGFSIDQIVRNYDVQTKNVLNIQMQDI